MNKYLYSFNIANCIIWTIFLAIGNTREYSAPGRTSKLRCGYGPTRYLAAPDIHPGVGDTCRYYECERGRYKLKNCKEGFGVHSRFMKFGRRGIAQKSYPCIVETDVCEKNTLEDTVSNTISSNDVIAAGSNGLNEVSDTRPISNPTPFVPNVKFCGVDLAFAIDISCSISLQNRTLVKKFVTDLIGKLKIGSGFVSVAGLTFGAGVYPIQYFDQSRSTQRTNFNFERMELVDKNCRTHTDEALELIRDQIFSEDRGDRPNMKNIFILTSDGNTYHGKKDDNQFYKERTIAAGRDIRAKGTESFVIALPTKKGKMTGMDEWLEIAGDMEHVFFIDSFQNLTLKIDELVEASCKDTTFKFWD